MRAATLAFVAVLVGCAAHRSTLASWRPMTPARFNVLAQRLDLPLYWQDDDGDGAPRASEMRALAFYGTPGAGTEAPTWVEDGSVTPALDAAVDRILAEDRALPPSDVRRALLREQLDRGEPDLVETDASQWPSEDREFLRRMIVATDRIDALFARQRGLDALRPRLDASDTIARAYFRVSWTPQCPTGVDSTCSAIEGAPPLVVDVWPASLQNGTNAFCEAMLRDPTLRSYETVVREGPSGLRTIGYEEAYADLVRPAADALRHAADALSVQDAIVAEYVRAVATDLETGSYDARRLAPRMTPTASRWFVDAGADGSRAWEPCRRKEAYHLTLGRFDPDAAAIAERVTSRVPELAAALASVAPAVHAERAATLRPTDFVRIVVVGGDDRRITMEGISQADRSMVYTNVYASNEAVQRNMNGRARCLADPALVRVSPEHAQLARLLVTLHETSHDLAPALEDDALSAVPAHPLLHILREVYAESAARYLAGHLEQAGVLGSSSVDAMLADSIGYDARWLGMAMYTQTGARRDAAQAGAIRMGMLVDLGVVRWDPDVPTADGAYRGAIVVDFAALRAANVEVMRRVLHVVGTGDWAALEDLVARYVDSSPIPLAELVARSGDSSFTQLVFSIRW